MFISMKIYSTFKGFLIDRDMKTPCISSSVFNVDTNGEKLYIQLCNSRNKTRFPLYDKTALTYVFYDAGVYIEYEQRNYDSRLAKRYSYPIHVSFSDGSGKVARTTFPLEPYSYLGKFWQFYHVYSGIHVDVSDFSELEHGFDIYCNARNEKLDAFTHIFRACYDAKDEIFPEGKLQSLRGQW